MALPLKIEHRVGIQAPAEVIWAFVSDIEGWSRWNPLYPKASGKLAFGEKLELEVALPGQKPQIIRPTITDWTPNEQIIWELSMFAGLLSTKRYIEIESLGPASCIFSNGELFEGFMLRFFTRKQRDAIKKGFAAFAETVRTKAEADWQAQAPAAT
ncbi:MAG TPA: SRPBCC domain-containing protein [Caulobacteraceae bacterium]|jgi:hypothetical protein